MSVVPAQCCQLAEYSAAELKETEKKCERPEKSAVEFSRISQWAEKGLIFKN